MPCSFWRSLLIGGCFLGCRAVDADTPQDAPSAPTTTASANVPTIRFEQGPVAYEQRSRVRDFNVSVTFARQPTTRPAVELMLDVGRGEPRTFAAVASGGDEYSVSAPLVPEYLHPQRLRISARYAAGRVNCNIEDSELDLGNGRTLMLGDIRRCEGGKSPRLVLASGRVLHALPTGLQYMRADLGPVALTLNLALAEEFTVEPSEASPDAVRFRIQVKEGSRVLAEQAGVIRVTGAPKAEAAPGTPATAGEAK